MELTVVVHQERAGFWSEVPELSGCFASGTTLEELREALAESVGLYVWNAPAAPLHQSLALGKRTVSIDPPAGAVESVSGDG